MRLAVGADHAGFELKNQLVPWLQSLGHELRDLSPDVLRNEMWLAFCDLIRDRCKEADVPVEEFERVLAMLDDGE